MQNIIVDNGTGSFKAGIAGDDKPRVVLPNLVGRSGSEFFAGDEALGRKNSVDISYPMEHGVVTNWDDMEKFWQYAFGKLNVDVGNHGVLMTEAPGNPPENRLKMAEIMFEKLKVRAFYVPVEPILALYAVGRMSGLILDSGASVTYVSTVFEGFAIPEGKARLDLGGRDLDDSLVKILNSKFGVTTDRETARDIKEKLCCVTLDGPSGCQGNSVYKMPDGKEITLGNERCNVPEALFQPSLLGSDRPGIHHMIQQSISKCETDTRKTMFKNIILSGGSTMLCGFPERLNKEMSALVPGESVEAHIVAHKDRALATWIGGSIMCSLSTFNDKACITRKEYEEEGAAVVKRKCPS